MHCHSILILFAWIQLHVEACDHHHHGGHVEQSSNSRTLRSALLQNQGDEEGEEDGVTECGFRRPTEFQMKEDEQRMKVWKRRAKRNIFRRSGRTYEIPVYMHIIQSSFFKGRVSSELTRQYIDYLNEAFRRSKAPFSFRYVRTSWNVNTYWSANCGNVAAEREFKKQLKVGGAESLNVYFCDEISNGRGGFLAGYAYAPFPDSRNFVRDGVVLSKSSNERRMNTFVHEVGHYLGLLHTFDGNSCDPNSLGDHVSDTPAHLMNKQILEAVNCKTSPINWNTCPSARGRDPVDNYMTYSPDNLCRERFTSGQVERMIAQFELYRQPPALRPVATRSPTTQPTSKPTAEPSSSPTLTSSVPPTPSPTWKSITWDQKPFFSFFLPKQPTLSPTSSPTNGPGLKGVGAVISVTCSSMFSTCRYDSDCCSGNCAFLFYASGNMCWI